ncbi:MAG: polymer-forming cytoskeletal protein [Anaerolineae bacterium]|nr:polymer-forming cytoskeletal protein [Anaerolineae bacterium]
MFGARKTQTTQGVQSTPGTTGQPSTQAPRQPVGFETVLGANSTLKGEFRSQANVRIDGTFEGKLEIDGNVLVGETARITADIHAKNISVAGAVRGNISGNKIQLLRTGRVWGDISATAITTEEGAFIDGKITMLGHPAGIQGFEPAGSLPAPEINTLQPIAEDAESGEPVEAELMDEDKVPRNNSGDKGSQPQQ